MSVTEDIVAFRDVTVRYPGRVVFDRFNAEVRPGLTALLGPSGSGKTTLLALLAGLDQPDEGEVVVPRHLRHPNGIGQGWIMQSANVLARRTALDNVAVPLLANGASVSEAVVIAERALADLGLASSTHKVAGTLSGGERQRVAVARVLASDAPIVLADEPTASLGDEHRRRVVEHLATVGSKGRLVVVATHDRWVADQCGDVIDLSVLATSTAAPTR